MPTFIIAALILIFLLFGIVLELGVIFGAVAILGGAL